MNHYPEQLRQPATSGAGHAMPDLTQLHNEHAEIEGLSRELSVAISQSTPPDARTLYGIRMKLASALIRHLKTEDWLLYPCLLQSPDKQVALTARTFSAAMGGIAKDFKEYAGRWGARAIESDWNRYQGETAVMLRHLAQRISREESYLYPLLETIRKAQMGQRTVC